MSCFYFTIRRIFSKHGRAFTLLLSLLTTSFLRSCTFSLLLTLRSPPLAPILSSTCPDPLTPLSLSFVL